MSTLAGPPYGLTEDGANYAEAAAIAATRQAEATHPARRLGFAQRAIATALTLPPEQVHAYLAEALGRIKDPEATA